MKVAVIPDGAMLVINLINKNNHTYISPTNFSKRNVEDTQSDDDVVDKSKPPYTLTGKKILNTRKYISDEMPSGVKGRVSLMANIIESAEAVILLSKRPKNYKPLYNVLNELIMYGSSGCTNAHKHIIRIVMDLKIPKLILKHPLNQEEQIKLINTTDKFLKNLDENKGKDILFNPDNINFELKEERNTYSYTDLKELFNS